MSWRKCTFISYQIFLPPKQQIENIERPFDRQRNRSRDFCFIIFETEEAAESAISNPKQVIGGKECDIKLAHPQRNQGGGGMGGGHMGGGGGFGGPRGGRGQSGGGGGGNTFFKNSNRSGGGGGGAGGNTVGNNWRNSDGRPAGGFRTGGHDDGRGFNDTQFLTNMDTMPNNGYGYKNSGYNNNFFPNYWN